MKVRATDVDYCIMSEGSRSLCSFEVCGEWWKPWSGRVFCEGSGGYWEIGEDLLCSDDPSGEVDGDFWETRVEFLTEMKRRHPVLGDWPKSADMFFRLRIAEAGSMDYDTSKMCAEYTRGEFGLYQWRLLYAGGCTDWHVGFATYGQAVADMRDRVLLPRPWLAVSEEILEY